MGHPQPQLLATPNDFKKRKMNINFNKAKNAPPTTVCYTKSLAANKSPFKPLPRNHKTQQQDKVVTAKKTKQKKENKQLNEDKD